MSDYWIAVGDVHGSAARIAEIPGAGEARGIIVSGDITNAGGRTVAASVLREIETVNSAIYAQIGNMDYGDVLGYLEERGWNIHARGVRLDGDIGLMGVGCSITTPFGTPSEVRDEQLADWLEEAHSSVAQLSRLILVSHTPPHGTVADRVDRSRHVGSRAVREFIDRVQPEVCIAGHIHESDGEERIGRTKLINPGMLPAGGYAVIRAASGGLDAELKRV
jgi:hypothetical protein